MKYYYCTESDKIITDSEIMEIYQSESDLQTEYTFIEYLTACQYWNGGTLIPVRKNIDKIPSLVWAIEIVAPWEFTFDEKIELAQKLSESEIEQLFERVKLIESGEIE